MSKRYYKLPKDKQWLTDMDDPSSIGGRDTDISQIATSLIAIFLDMFSELNESNIEVTAKIANLRDLLENGENLIQEIINDISEIVANSE